VAKVRKPTALAIHYRAFESLDKSLRAIGDGERESSKDRWDLDFVVDQIGRDHTSSSSGFAITRSGSLSGVLRARRVFSSTGRATASTRVAAGGPAAEGRSRGSTCPRAPVPRSGSCALAGARHRRSLLLQVPTEVDDASRVQDVAARYQLNPASVTQSVEGYTKAIETTYANSKIVSPIRRRGFSLQSNGPIR